MIPGHREFNACRVIAVAEFNNLAIRQKRAKLFDPWIRITGAECNKKAHELKSFALKAVMDQGADGGLLQSDGIRVL